MTFFSNFNNGFDGLYKTAHDTQDKFLDFLSSGVTKFADKADTLIEKVIPGDDNDVERLLKKIVDSFETHAKNIIHNFDEKTDVFFDRLVLKVKDILKDENKELIEQSIKNIAKTIVASVLSGESLTDNHKISMHIDKLEDDILSILTSHTDEFKLETKLLLSNITHDALAELDDMTSNVSNVTVLDFNNETVMLVGDSASLAA
jgi:hypothetical protein